MDFILALFILLCCYCFYEGFWDCSLRSYLYLMVMGARSYVQILMLCILFMGLTMGKFVDGFVLHLMFVL